MSDWKAKGEAKKRAIRASIPAEWIVEGITPETTERALDFPFQKYLTTEEMEITGLSVVELLARIAKGQYQAVTVARAFAHRAAIAHQLVNCCLEFFWSAAERQAKALDEYYTKYGKTIGPLHGLPISLKGIASLISLSRSISRGWSRDFHGIYRLARSHRNQ
jgi:amidase